MTNAPIRDATKPTLDDALRRRSLIASNLGNALEWYDWNVYAIFTPFLAAALFDDTNRVSALLSTLAVFGAGFLMRPLGGIVFGIVADRIGRQRVLVTTMLTMALASLAIGLLPGFDNVGVWASVGLLLCRLVQGFAHGGEATAVYTYVAEIAPRRRRGLWSSLVFVSVIAGSLLATGLGALLTSNLGQAAILQWGWRIPFVLGGLFAVVVLYLRRSAMESDAFDHAVAAEPLPKHVRRQAVRPALKILFFTASVPVVYYTWIAFGASNAINEHGMAASDAFVASFLAQLTAVATIPLFGWLSDRIGRKKIALGYAVASGALVVPLTLLISDAGWTLFVAQALAITAWAMIASIYAAMVAEQFPARVRTRGIGIPNSFSNALFGGTAPYLSSWLVTVDRSWVFAAYLVVLCVVSALLAPTLREGRGIDMSE